MFFNRDDSTAQNNRLKLKASLDLDTSSYSKALNGLITLTDALLKKTEALASILNANVRPVESLRFTQEILALLDENELVNFYGIRVSDGMAVVERETVGADKKATYHFEAVPPERVRRIAHHRKITLAQYHELLIQNKLL